MIPTTGSECFFKFIQVSDMSMSTDILWRWNHLLSFTAANWLISKSFRKMDDLSSWLNLISNIPTSEFSHVGSRNLWPVSQEGGMSKKMASIRICDLNCWPALSWYKQNLYGALVLTVPHRPTTGCDIPAPAETSAQWDQLGQDLCEQSTPEVNTRIENKEPEKSEKLKKKTL